MSQIKVETPIPAARPRFMLINKILSYDPKDGRAQVLCKPFGWRGTGKVRIDGVFNERPLEGQALKVLGDVKREARLHHDGEPALGSLGQPLYNLVIKAKSKVEVLGRTERMAGTVTRVFASQEGDAVHPSYSIALIQPVGSQYQRKVFSTLALHEGEFIEAQGVTDKVPAYRFKDGKAVEPICAIDGTQIYHYDFHATDTVVRHDPALYAGEVLKVWRSRDGDGLCIARVHIQGFNRDKPINCYLNLPEKGRLEEGDRLSVQGYCVEKEAREPDGKLKLRQNGTPWTNLVVQAVHYEITPKMVLREEENLKVGGMVEDLEVKMGVSYAETPKLKAKKQLDLEGEPEMDFSQI